MLGRFRSAIYNAIGTLEAESGAPVNGGHHGGDGRSGNPGNFRESSNGSGSGSGPKVKYPYQRPVFLQLFTDDEIQVTADHAVRPIMVPRDIQILPWFAGYAEAINAGKSLRNEDQASYHRGVLRTRDLPAGDDESNHHFEIPYVYFGIFDGHAGSGCAVAAANDLHQIVHKRLMGVLIHLVNQMKRNSTGAGWAGNKNFAQCDVTVESMVIGALESAFWELDQQIGREKKRYKLIGGCTALVAVFILGKLYMANAGDSRGVLCRDKAAYPMSFDFTPVTERQRLQQLGYQKPHLLGQEYTHLDFCRRPLRKDLGSKMLYRDAHMTGWAYKEITEEDLKFPIVYGEGKRSRLLATIGVTRGFGDHDLAAQSSTSNPVLIKPFLTPQPEVRVLDVEQEDITESDVLVMATDGLWDVIPNERVADIVHNGLKTHTYAGRRKKIRSSDDNNDDNDDDDDDNSDDKNDRKKYRYISIAQDLVMAARGKLIDRNWKRSLKATSSSSVENSDLLPATVDDISVFVIPILAYKDEYLQWKLEKMARTSSDGISLSSDPEDAIPDGTLRIEEAIEAVNDKDNDEIDH